MRMWIVDDPTRELGSYFDIDEVPETADVVIIQQPRQYIVVKRGNLYCEESHEGDFLDRTYQRNKFGFESVRNQAIYDKKPVASSAETV